MSDPASILFENDRFLAVEKAPGISMATRPGQPEAEREVLAALGAPDPSSLFLIHRLDRGTSGVVLLAKDAEAHRAASRLFQERAVAKTYRAVVWGRPAPPNGSIDAPLALDRRDRRKMLVAPAGKRSVTGYATVERLPSITLLELSPETGRTHQIRVHLASRGHPIVGDDLYGGPRWRGIREPSFRRALEGVRTLLLHAASLAFRDPFSGAETTIRSEPPAPWREVLEAARRARGSAQTATRNH